MRSLFDDIKFSQWYRSVLFLIVIYFSQVYPFYHLHHYHYDDASEIAESFLPVDVDYDHETDHHHHGQSRPEDAHQHTYEKHIDWHILRTPNIRTIAYDNNCVQIASCLDYIDDKVAPFFQDIGKSKIEVCYFPRSVVRGPPSALSIA